MTLESTIVYLCDYVPTKKHKAYHGSKVILAQEIGDPQTILISRTGMNPLCKKLNRFRKPCYYIRPQHAHRVANGMQKGAHRGWLFRRLSAVTDIPEELLRARCVYI